MTDLWHTRQISVAGSLAPRHLVPRTLAPKIFWSKHINIIKMLVALWLFKCRILSRPADSKYEFCGCREPIVHTPSAQNLLTEVKVVGDGASDGCGFRQALEGEQC